MKQLPLVTSFVLFIALCVSIAYWGMQLFKPSARPVTAPPQAALQEVRLDAAAALFGGRPAAVAVASNYELKGVVMSGTAGESVAILSADGKPATATAIDQEVMPGVTVKEVHPQYVLLSEHGVIKRVELPDSARSQSGMQIVSPVDTSPVPPGENGGSVQSLAPAPESGAPPVSAGPTPGYAGAPPLMQSSPETTQPAASNGVINIPAPR